MPGYAAQKSAAVILIIIDVVHLLLLIILIEGIAIPVIVALCFINRIAKGGGSTKIVS